MKPDPRMTKQRNIGNSATAPRKATEGGRFARPSGLGVLLVAAVAPIGAATTSLHAQAPQLSYHSTSVMVGDTRYFTTDIFVSFDEPCGRVLLYYQSSAHLAGVGGGFFHASVPGVPASMVPAPNNQGLWSVDTHFCIGGDTQVPRDTPHREHELRGR